MFMTRSEYDRGVNTFSPEGRLFQVEYAIEAIKLGSTAIAIKTAHGIVMAVEKRITSPLMEPSSMDKIMEIDAHIGCAVSGLTADAQSMVEHGRVQAQNHYFTYNEPMPARALTQSLCALSANFGTDDEDSMSRPFGVALLVAGLTINGMPASSAHAAFSANPHTGKLKALTRTATPLRGTSTCCPQKRADWPSLIPSPSAS